MKIGCFALVEPFAAMERQFQAIREMGIQYADITDNHDGASLGVEYGFTGSISLDSHPGLVRKMVNAAGLTLTSFCAHANLLDPPAPDSYGSHELIKAIRLARLLDIRHVITSEGDPRTPFGLHLSPEQRLFAISEKLYAPILWAEEMGVQILLEPHGVVTGATESMAALLELLGHEDAVGVCLDTGNSWLAGAEPLEYVERFGPRIGHVHWKDIDYELATHRGRRYGCGMTAIPLGDGMVDIQSIVKALQKVGFDGATTMEIAGRENVLESVQRLRKWME